MRVLLMRWGLRTVFGLPRPVRRLLAGRSVRVRGQEPDLDLQLLGRLSTLIESHDGGVLDRAALAEQRRQADLAAEAAAEPGLDDVVVRDLTVPGGAHPRPAKLYVPPIAGPEPAGLLLFFHGGGFALGSWPPPTRCAGCWRRSPGSGCCRWATASPPSTPTRRRWRTRWPPTATSAPRRARWGRDPSSSPSVATAPAATSPWSSPTRSRCTVRRSCWPSTRSPTSTAPAAPARSSAPASD